MAIEYLLMDDEEKKSIPVTKTIGKILDERGYIQNWTPLSEEFRDDHSSFKVDKELDAYTINMIKEQGYKIYQRL